MNNKDFANLLLKEIREMHLLCESLSEIDEIPTSLLNLSKEKADSMVSILNQLIENSVKGSVEGKKIVDQSSQLLVEKQKEEKIEKKPIIQENITEKNEKELDVCEDFQDKKVDKTKINSNFGTIVVDDKKEISIKREEKVDETANTTNVKSVKNSSSVHVPKKSLSAESRFVKSLKLCLGDKFRYKKELFNDDMELLNVTMAELDRLTSLDEAFAYVERFGWDEGNPAVEDFFDLLQSRFS